MVDIVANNVMATSINTSFSTYMFKEPVTLIAFQREMPDVIFF